MTTPQQFLESFLQEKSAAWNKARPHLSIVYSKYFGEPLSQHTERFMPFEGVRTDIEDVKQSRINATAVGREHLPSGDIRTRYRLEASGDSWKIIGLDRECFICRGKGETNNRRCGTCKGEGWILRF